MSSVECLREFVNERLTAAAAEIFGVFKQTIVKYEEEIDRQRRLLDIVWKPEIKLHRTELPQQHFCTEVEVLADQQLCIQERNSSLDQEDPEPPQIKEEQEELCTSQEGEQLVLKQETDTFMLTPTDERYDHSEDQTPKIRISSVVSEPNNDHQLLSHNSQVAESQDQKRGEHGGSGSTRDAEPEPQKRHHKSKIQSNKVYNFTMSKVHRNTHTELPQRHVCKEEEVLADQQLCIQERNSSLDQEDPEPPQIKEEQEELCTSQEGEQLVLKQGTDISMLTPTNEESDHSEDQSLNLNHHKVLIAAEIESVTLVNIPFNVVSEPKSDHQFLCHNSHVDSGSTRDAELERKNQHHESRSHSNSGYNSTMSEIHCNTNTGKKSFKCDTCGKGFKCKSKFKTHLRVHTGEKPYTCNTCGKRFSRTTELNIHIRIHTGEKPYICKTCGKDFRCGSELKVHMRTHTGEKPYICKTCGKDFRVNDHLLIHMRRAHTGEKPYLCTTCGKRFIEISTLKRHMIIHTGERPYHCTTCEKRFSDISTLKRHVIIHTGERPYLCTTCGKRFIDISRLKRHMTIHTGEKPYTCNTCGKAFRQTGALTVHMRRGHTGEEP